MCWISLGKTMLISNEINTKTIQISFTHGEDNDDTHLSIEVQLCYKMDKTAPIRMDRK